MGRGIGARWEIFLASRVAWRFRGRTEISTQVLISNLKVLVQRRVKIHPRRKPLPAAKRQRAMLVCTKRFVLAWLSIWKTLRVVAALLTSDP